MSSLDWTPEEVETVISDYLEMLYLECSGFEYNKAEHNRALQKIINRSNGSIEFKHSNISAVLIELGMPYIKGYQPRGNYQDLLRVCIEERLNHYPELVQTIEHEVCTPATEIPTVDFESMQVEVPKRDLKKSNRLYDKPGLPKQANRKNYLEHEARNRSLGLVGEKLILEYERQRLWKAGQSKLADCVEHVTQTKGDGLGYDILSYDVDGRERFIEVKTTRYGVMTPFFASRNEVEISENISTQYYLYRLFEFHKRPQFYQLVGSLRGNCSLESFCYRAIPK